jgi:formylglycine-generating enzyme required for sulfatase activity
MNAMSKMRGGAAALTGAIGLMAGCSPSTPAGMDNDGGTQASCVGSTGIAPAGDGGPPSCQEAAPGTTNCGPGGVGTASCCTSLEVPGGTYYRTFQNSEDTDAGPTAEADPATVSAFRLDQYLVTVGRFRSFVRAWDGGKGYTPPAGSGKHAHLNGGQGLANSANPGTFEPGWVASDDCNIAPTDLNLNCTPAPATWTASAGGDESLPINCITWYEAYAFCIWDGGFLPSEAEWEYAAAAGSQQREYPWGQTDPGIANQYAIYGDGMGSCYFPFGTQCNGVVNIAPVGTPAQGAGNWGQLDLAGETFEWNLDWYAAYVDPCVDCAYLSPSPGRVYRGGAFSQPVTYLMTWQRNDPMATARFNYLGFRCARTP